MKKIKIGLNRLILYAVAILFCSTVYAQGKLETVEIYQELKPSNKDPKELTLRIMDIWAYTPSSEIMDKIQKRLSIEQSDYYAATEEEILAGKTHAGAQIGDHTRYLLPEKSVPSDAIKYRIDRLPKSGEEWLRVSIASGVRILVPQSEGKPPKYLLLANRSSAKKGVLRYGPVGGAYLIDKKSEAAWRNSMEPMMKGDKFIPEEFSDELRFKARKWKIPEIVEAAMHFKEKTPIREIAEEMVQENPLIPREEMVLEAKHMQVTLNPRQPYSAEELANHARYNQLGSAADPDRHGATFSCQDSFGKPGEKKQ